MCLQGKGSRAPVELVIPIPGVAPAAAEQLLGTPWRPCGEELMVWTSEPDKHLRGFPDMSPNFLGSHWHCAAKDPCPPPPPCQGSEKTGSGFREAGGLSNKQDPLPRAPPPALCTMVWGGQQARGLGGPWGQEAGQQRPRHTIPGVRIWVLETQQHPLHQHQE